MPPRKKIAATPENPVDASVNTPVETPVKQKREKKSSKHKIVAVVTADGIQGSFQSETRRPLIAHLPVHSNEIQFHDQPFVYDPRPPGQFEAFDAGEIDPFSNEATYEPAPAIVGEPKEPVTQVVEAPSNTVVIQPVVTSTPSVPTASASRKEYGPTQLLVQFANSKHSHELPESTNLACFWCCHTFTGRPCVNPLRVIDGVWEVYGNFCTPQCCMAHLLSEPMDTHVRWERIALLHRLYGQNTNGRIYPAPNRECLSHFGGPIEIREFRAMCEEQRIRVDVHLPPMVSILASMDTKPIDFYETPLRSSMSTNNPYAHTKQDDTAGLKLKRNKPLKDKESTLDACMNIIMRA
jgi:hypothetical protein